MKVYLKDQFTGAVLARATTDASGAFEFRDVQAGVHGLGVVGPWKIIRGAEFIVHPDWSSSALVYVEPGPDQPDPDVPPPGGPPAPGAGAGQQGPADQLAATGANVTWLALGGLLTLLAGAGLMFRTRRRET